MKLHLPKRLFTALIAAISFIAPAALTLGSAAWGEDSSHWDITQDHSGDTQTIGSGDTLYIGNGTNDAKGSGTSSTVFESGKLTVESGGKLFIHGFTDSDRDIDTTGKLKITSDIEVQGGGTLHLEDGSYYFSGNINITGNAESISTIHSRWDKGFVFDRLTGAETASLKLTGAWSNTTFTLQGDGAYAGHIEVNNDDRDTRLVINSAGALASTASIAITGSNTKLAINTEAITLSHLSSVAGNSLILAKNTEQMGSVAAVDASTVTIRNASASDATFSGTIGSGITLEVASGAYQNFGAVTNNGNMVLNGTVNIATAITGNGTVEVGGLLTLADYNELYNFSYTYTNPDGGTNSGLRTGYTGYFSQGALTVGETGRLAIANSADASITDAGYVTVTFQQGDGIYYVNETLAYNAATMAADAVNSILVSSTGTLNVAGSSVGKNLSNAGTVNYSMDGGSVNVNSLFQTNTGVVKVDMNASSAETLTGAASLSADLGAGTGTVRVENAASFTNNGYQINSQKFVLKNVENATISGSSDKRISSSLELIQSNLVINRGDAFDYSDSSQLTYKIGAGSSLDVGSNRQSIRSNHIIEMAGGILKGAGVTYDGYVYGIDFYDGGRFNTSADSRIETNVGGHNSGTIQFDVNTGKTLVMTGSLVGKTSFSKTAGGTMEYSGAGFAQSMTITGGTFTYAVDEDRTMNGRLNGGTLKQSGTGVLTFNASTSDVGRGTVNVAAGGVAYNLGGSNTDEITLTGISGTTFTKKGAGTLQVNTSGYAGDIEVNEGTLKLNAKRESNAALRVGNGATLDVNGFAGYYNLTLAGGALLTNSVESNDSNNLGTGKMQMHTITISDGNATVSGRSDFGMIGSAYAQTSLYLGGNTLVKTGDNTFYMYNTYVKSEGTIQIDGGTVESNNRDNKTDLSAASVVVNADGEFKVTGNSQTIKELTLNGGGVSVAPGKSLTATGNVALNGGSVDGDLTAGSITVQEGASASVSGALTLNQASVIDGALTVESLTTKHTQTVNGNGTLTLNSALNLSTGTAYLTPTNGGTVTYQGSNIEGNGFKLATFDVITGNVEYGGDFVAKLSGTVLSVVTGVETPTATDYFTKTSTGLTLTIGSSSGLYYVNNSETLAYDTAGAYYVAEGATLTFSGTQDAILTKPIYGTGTAKVTFGTDNHNASIKFGEAFTGTVEVSGHFNVMDANFKLAENATLKLMQGQVWSQDGTATILSQNIELAQKGDTNYVSFIGGGSLTLNGAVTGDYLETTGQLVLTNAGNHVTELKVSGGTTTISAAGGTYGTLSLTGGTLDINESNFNVTGGITQTSGTVNFYSGTVNLAGESSFTKLDMAGSDDRSGHLILQEGAKMTLTSTGSFWLASSAKVTLLNGATLTRDGITLTGKGDTSVLKENGNKNNLVSFSTSNHQVTDMAVSVSSGSETTLGLKLINSDVTNSGTGKLVISAGDHTINTLHAKSGDIEFSSESSPTVATAKVEEGKTLTLNGGASINNIEAAKGTVALASGKTLTLNEGASINNIEAAKGTVALASGKTLTLNGSASIGKMDAANGIVVQALGSTMSLADQSENTIGTLIATQSEFYVGKGATVTINGGLNLYEQNNSGIGGIGSTVYLAADSVTSVALVLDSNNENARFSMDDASSVELEAGAKFYLGDILNVTGLKHDGEQKSTINATGWMVYSNKNVNVVMNNAAVQYTMNGDTTLKNRFTNSSLEIATQGSDVTTITNASNTITELSLTGGNAKLSESMSVQSISAKAGKAVTVANGKTISMAGGVNIGTNEGDATMTAKTDTALLQMQENASFTIADMELSNVAITAAEENTKVNLSNVDATTVQLTKGEFHMLDKPQVGTGGSAINLIEGGPTGLDFSTSLLNGMTLGVDASMVVDLGDLSGFTGMSSGKPTFSITLEGFRLSDYLAENPGIYFAADSWLGQLLVAQGASKYVKGDTLEAGAQATAGTGSGVSVSYTPTSVGVGTVITITGLQVPEPTTSTLGLIALTALVSRRRRK